jgi:L-ribulokinase
MTLGSLQAGVTAVRERFTTPSPKTKRSMPSSTQLYRTLHDAFGTRDWTGNLHHVMKSLLAIRAQQNQ